MSAKDPTPKGAKEGEMRSVIQLKGGVTIGLSINDENNQAKVIIEGNVASGGRFFRNVPLLVLDIEKRQSNEPYMPPEVKEYYPRKLPYLKPIRDFREFVDQQLRTSFLLNSSEKEAWVVEGVENYLSRLKSYSDVKSLAQQIRDECKRIHTIMEAWRLRWILRLMRVQPLVDNRFERTY